MPSYNRKDKGTMTAAMAETIDAARSKTWLNPIAMSQLQAAVKAKKKEAVLDGTRYSITYGIQFRSKVLDTVTESVKLKRTDGQFVPFGYVSMKRIMEFDFERGH